MAPDALRKKWPAATLCKSAPQACTSAASLAMQVRMASVAICICTYRRPLQLDRLLQELADQRWKRLRQPSIAVVVVENEAGGVAEEVCLKHIALNRLNILYSSEPRPGVAMARNRCSEIAAQFSEFIAFIDDDELPAKDWLEQLMLLQQATEADVVAGKVLGSYLNPPPPWLVSTRIHDTSPPVAVNGSKWGRLVTGLLHPFPALASIASGSRIEWCDTGNVLFRTDIVRRGFRFDETMGELGYGTDTLFFRQVARSGYKMVWSNEAVAYHEIPPERATAAWIIRRSLQQGFCAVVIESRFRGRAARRIETAFFGLAWAFVNVAVAAVSLIADRRRYVWHMSEAARWLGRCAAILGMTVRYNRRAASPT